jgi:alkanesulfonate monooxygenase SsuD/methylene tetrahydromethanopterin reductase-like flavin-dependent oxidoreductase (luciferase family)
VPRLFALDQNFPAPIVSVLTEYQEDAELVRVSSIDSRLADLDDWEILLALHNHDRQWDGLITNDTSMLNQPRELSVLVQTKLTLVDIQRAGHNPVKASGMLFAYLSRICQLTHIHLGISIVPYTDSLERNRELVHIADEGGLALVGVQDHPYQRHFLDTWSLVPMLLADTKRISLFTDVANLPLRPPAVMAKAAASLDILSGGRFELGLGAGAIPDLIANFGGPRRTPGEAVEALEEAIEVIRLLWSEQRSVSFAGSYYRLEDARPGPHPVHPISIWLGAFKPRMLRLVGRKGDGWLPSLGVLTREQLRDGNCQIDAAAASAGRDPAAIRRILNLQGLISEQQAPQRSELGVGYLAGEPLAGPPDWWIQLFQSLAEDGFDTVVFWPVDPSPAQVELLIDEVLPALSHVFPSKGQAQSHRPPLNH